LDFFSSFFKEAYAVINHHKGQIQKYGLITPNINYMDLFDFLHSAANFLYEIDYDVITGLPVKLYKDIESLVEYYKKIKKLNSSYVFYNIYLPKLSKYKKLQNHIEDLKQKISKYETILRSTEAELKSYKTPPKNREELKEYKRLKKINVDAIYFSALYKEQLAQANMEVNQIEEEEGKKFFSIFEKTKQEILQELNKIINTKLYYFDKLIWYNASNSPKVVHFFKNADIHGDISSETYLKYQLQHIDESKSFNNEKIRYLKNLIKVIK